MSSEPKWPKPMIGPRPGSPEFPGDVKPSWRNGFNQAIKECRAAFLEWQRIENDDPATDPIGTVRQAEAGGVFVRLDVRDLTHWWSVSPVGGAMVHDATVKGWPIIGAVPGTPAAKDKP